VVAVWERLYASVLGRLYRGVIDIPVSPPWSMASGGSWPSCPPSTCSSLDPLSAGVIEALITGLKGRYTILLVTHNLPQARRLADTVAVCWVSEGCGCVVESGPCGVLFERAAHPITRAYCGGEVG